MELVADGVELLDEATCRRLLGSAQIGRVVIAVGEQPVVFPVNYVVVSGDIVFFTNQGMKLDAVHRRDQITFEVDDIDVGRKTGWSVLVVGSATVAPADVAEHARNLGCYPWAAGLRATAVRIRPDFLSGRRVGATPAV
jgi:nitroimidazol reductase NimA-like FMN-containing flavoprotein (pyridoxamine 5'-phosphate oxidase superfamily)